MVSTLLLGVSVFQVGAEPEWRELLHTVTVVAKAAIGRDSKNSLAPRIDAAGLVLVHEAKRWQTVVLSPPSIGHLFWAVGLLRHAGH